MTRPDDPTELESLESVERLLDRFRPARAPGALRARVLAAASTAATQRPRQGIGVILWRSAVAAGIVAAVWLNLAADRVAKQIGGQIGNHEAIQTRQAKQVANLFDDKDNEYRSVAMAWGAGPVTQ